MATYPPRGSTPWDNSLKAYIDGRDAEVASDAADALDALEASAIPYAGGTLLPASSVEAALDALDGRSPLAGLATGVDLNSLTSPGRYYRESTVGVTKELNYPLDSWAGVIEVDARSDASYVIQRAYSRQSDDGSSAVYSNVFYRTFYGESWRPWRRIDTRFEGVGSPNGAVAAPVGTRYVDTAATNGAREWYKNTNTGNTGWIVTNGDTGDRNIAANLHPDWALSESAPAFRLRRANSTVTLTARIRRVTEGGLRRLVSRIYDDAGSDSWPSGFGALDYGQYASIGAVSPASGLSIPGGLLDGGGSKRNGRIAIPGDAGSWGVGDSLSFQTSWTTADPWPTSLPGTPA